MAVSAPNPALEKLITIIENRKPTFGKAAICLALARNEQNAWKVAYGLITFLARGDQTTSDQKFDYGNLILTKKLVDVPEVVILLRSIFEKQVLKLDDVPEIPLRVPMFSMSSVPSQIVHGVLDQWPVIRASQSIESITAGQLPYESLSKLGLPLFPDGTEAVISLFGLKRAGNWPNLSSFFEVNIPDFRARIKSLRLAGNRITLEVQTGELAENDLRAKFFCRNEYATYISDDLPIQNGQAVFVAKEEPFIIEAHVLSTIDGDSIDRRRFDYRYPSMEGGVVIENSEVQLLDMISKGENETVEFKVTLDAKNHKEFLESIVAFANTSGGTIFLGVNDNCRIGDFREDVKARIADLVHANCDPAIEVQVRRVNLIGDHQITIVEVAEGENKPYVLNNRGIFIRRGSSDRQIKRTELDELYVKKNQEPSTVRGF